MWVINCKDLSSTLRRSLLSRLSWLPSFGRNLHICQAFSLQILCSPTPNCMQKHPPLFLGCSRDMNPFPSQPYGIGFFSTSLGGEYNTWVISGLGRSDTRAMGVSMVGGTAGCWLCHLHSRTINHQLYSSSVTSAMKFGSSRWQPNMLSSAIRPFKCFELMLQIHFLNKLADTICSN